MDLSTPAGLETLARDVAELLGAHRTEQDGAPDRVRIIFADGRTLELVPNRPRTRITITAVLPAEAAAQDLAIEPITVTALPRPRPSETQDKATARHTADHIRRRLLPQQTAVASRLSATVERARTALSALPDRPEQRWAVSDLPVPHPLGLDRWCHIAWWHTPAGESRAVASFLADLLRRAGLATTEPHGSAHVFFADPPAQQPDARFHVAPASRRDGWDLVDQFTGAVVRTYDDAQWAQRIAESASSEDEAARRAGTPSADLPGLSDDLIEVEQVRALAVELAMAGHMPYGLVDVDYTQTPGFFIYPGPQPSMVRVARLLEPWGAIRPGARFEAPKHEVERYDTELEAYARLLNGPGQTVAVQLDGIQVTFSDPSPGP
ncbi:hypothetical protein ACIBW9_41730 [Streptomyces sp. NPDC049541]|uniref:hypothetical protein n=1 Tax=Streptomyces sp. NPDC049541 TaxID=3365594 RepID=UPI0037BAD184